MSELGSAEIRMQSSREAGQVPVITAVLDVISSLTKSIKGLNTGCKLSSTGCSAIALFTLLFVQMSAYTASREEHTEEVWMTSGTRMVLEKHAHALFPLIPAHSGSSASKDTDFGASSETQSLHTLQLLILST